MMNYLKHTTLENQSKKDILQKITELTERFAPNKTWFIKVMNELFVNFGDMITDDILSKLIAIINEWESETDDLNEFKRYTVENYATIVENYSVLPESLVKLMAWVIGEYTCKLYFNDNEKIKGIIQMLSYLLNKTYDDEMTKCLLISAIAKINSNINYTEQNLVNDIMERYSREKNTELQQRCLEYKRTQAKNAPIEKNTFTTIEETPSLDFDLSFLNNYVQQKSQGKIYDPSISEMFMDKFSSNEVQLNVGPYAMNSNILSMPSKGNNINSLYEVRDNNLVENMKSELNVRGEQKWGAQGYKEETKKSMDKPNYINTQGISSSSNLFYNGNSNKESSSSSKYDKNSSKRNKEEELNPENQAKKTLMKGLFGGIGGEEENEEKPEKQKKTIPKKNVNTSGNNLFAGTKVNNNNGGMNLFEGMIKNSDTNNSSNQQTDLLNMGNNNNLNSNTGNIDLLGFGDNSQQQNIRNINNNGNQGSIDLLGDIFGGGGNTTSNTTNDFSNTQQNNIFDAFENNNFNNNSSNNNNNLFGNLNTQNTNNNLFTPYNISTEEFGELWGNYPDEDIYEMNINISNPQQFHDIIKNKGNYAAIDIINNEAISAANYKNQVSLVHATVELNKVTLLVKCQNKELNQEVAKYVIELFK